MRIFDLSVCSVYPPLSGGTNRIFSINSEISKKCYVFQFALIPSEYVYISKASLVGHALRSFREGSAQFLGRSRMIQINEKYTQFTHGNVLFLILGRLASRKDLPEFVPPLLDRRSLQVARREIRHCDLVQIETPWPFDWVLNNTPKSKPMVLVEHDVVYRLYKGVCTDRVLQVIREKEQRAVERADAILVVSYEDQEALCEEYCVDRTKVHIVPHGIDTSRVKPPSEAERAESKARFGFSEKIVVLFTGCTHFPNIAAVEAIHSIASQVKDEKIVFVIAGSVGERVRQRQVPNVRYTGYVNEIEPYFRMADIGINPITSGGGTNTKMIEYLANGLPVVTTVFGSRGIDLEDGKHAIVSDIGQFPDMIVDLARNQQTRTRLGEEGRRLIENHYDWKVIVRKIWDVYEALVGN